MRVGRVVRLLLIAVLLGAAVSVVSGQGSPGKVRGQVLDGSDAVVPGVTVEAVAGAQVLATAVTDEMGTFEFPELPAGPLSVRMSLDGFETLVMQVTVQPGGSLELAGHLQPASFSERVTVTAPAPKAMPDYPPLPPEPVYEVRPLSPLDLESVCGPAKARPEMTALATIASHHQEGSRALYRLGDQLTLKAEPGSTLTVGQNLAAGRLFKPANSTANVTGELTAGVVQVVAVNPEAAVGVVVHSCGELRQGDLLTRFEPEPLLVPDPPGVPDYREPARILFGDADQMMGAPGRLMVIDRGRTQGIRQGQRLTLFRNKRGNRTIVGEALVLAVRSDSARIRVEHANDAIWSGDSAAPHSFRSAFAFGERP
jgi:hypothetical protein